ncbi:MAG: class I tRNA ligase family protein, partial [Chloroflexota bacterium]
MSLPKRYNPRTTEPQLRDQWLDDGTYHFDQASSQPIFSIDTPPPTVSGHLHLGHIYSYTQTDFMARFWRMNGRSIFYPMGFDDNGLPTEKLIEKRDGTTVHDIGRQAFIERCLAISEEAEQDYKALWQRIGLSVDWRYSYRTIDEKSRRISQRSFVELFNQGLAYQKQAPTIWCPECQTAIAQAELDDMDKEANFYTLAFSLPDGQTLPIATTRPELLPACVAIFVHPEDGRFQHLIKKTATTPLFGKAVPILADPHADPEKGSGAVMCCTFGDQMDIQWWQTHSLPLIEMIGKDGRLTENGLQFANLSTGEARQQIIKAIDGEGKLIDQTPISHTIRVH